MVGFSDLLNKSCKLRFLDLRLQIDIVSEETIDADHRRIPELLGLKAEHLIGAQFEHFERLVYVFLLVLRVEFKVPARLIGDAIRQLDIHV